MATKHDNVLLETKFGPVTIDTEINFNKSNNMEIQIFNNVEFGEIRTVEENGKVLFCGSDVAKALGYAVPRKAIIDHCKGVLKRNTPTNGGIQEMSFISEGDVYRLITHSKLPAAEKFEHWVFDEVLPSIRKNGGYIHTTAEDTPEVIMAKAILLADKTIQEQKALLAEQAAKIEEDKPKVLFHDAVIVSNEDISIGELAKLICKKGVTIGERKLFDWMRTNGYLVRRKSGQNLPMQRCIDLGWMVVEEKVLEIPRTRVLPNGEIEKYVKSIICLQTKITPKGQVYFINKYLKENAPV